jgi:hypothetical protein
MRITAGDRDPDLAEGNAHLGTDTEQLQADGVALRSRPSGARQRDRRKALIST